VRLRVGEYLSLVKFAHSIFALPFALIAYLVAGGGTIDARVLALVIVCMVAARSAAMAYNRLVDRSIDAANPRTAGREIPSGVISTGGALAFTLGSCAVFVLACALLNRACLYLSLPVLGVLLGYTHAKRFTALAHLWLGVALGLGPVAAWVAQRGVLDLTLTGPVILGLGVAGWVMGFDILYACQDEEFDRANGLHSIPARFGRPAALWISSLVHFMAVALFCGFGVVTGLGAAYYAGVAVVAVVLVAEHRVISPTDMSRVDMAFFTMNGVVSLLMLLGTAFDVYLH
jgi:4-hydroxybenzoate polyprenyltransferase